MSSFLPEKDGKNLSGAKRGTIYHKVDTWLWRQVPDRCKYLSYE